MAYQQSDLERLDRMIANGTTSIEVDGRKISYRSMTDLLAARVVVATALASAAGDVTAVRRVKVTSTKDL